MPSDEKGASQMAPGEASMNFFAQPRPVLRVTEKSAIAGENPAARRPARSAAKLSWKGSSARSFRAEEEARVTHGSSARWSTVPEVSSPAAPAKGAALKAALDPKLDPERLRFDEDARLPNREEMINISFLQLNNKTNNNKNNNKLNNNNPTSCTRPPTPARSAHPAPARSRM